MTAYETQVGGLSPVVWFKFDETSGNAVSSGSKTPTLTATSVTPGIYSHVSNKSVYYNGTSSKHYFGGSSVTGEQLTGMNDGVFTIEFWMRANTIGTSANQVVWNYWDTADSNRHIGAYVRGTGISNTGKITYYTLRNGINYQETTSTSRVDDGKWHHIVVAQNGTTTKLYIDGTLETTKTDWSWTTFGWDSNSGVKALFGAGVSSYTTGGGTEFYKGYFDEFAIYSSELSSTNITANYNSGKSAFANTVGSLLPEIWIPFDETSGTPTNIGATPGVTIGTTTGSPTLNQTTDISGKSVLFDGNDGYILTGSSATNTFADGNFSIEAWVKTSKSTDIQEIFQYAYSSATNGTYDGGWALRLDLGKPQTYYIAKSGQTFKQITHASSIADGAWHHLVMTVATSGGSYDLKLYVDGSLSTSSTANSSTTPTSTSDGNTQVQRYIGYSVNNNEYYTGSIDEFAIYTTALTLTQVGNNYAARSSALSYSSAPMTSSGLLVDPTITAVKNLSYSSAPMTTSALMSNVYAGGSVIDAVQYTVARNANGTFNTSTNQFRLGYDADGSEAKFMFFLNGLGAGNDILKVKFKSTLTVNTSALRQSSPTFNIYSVNSSSEASDWIVQNTNTFPANITYLYTTRLSDDGSGSNYYLDLTPALVSTGSANVNLTAFYIQPNWSFTGSGEDNIKYSISEIEYNVFDALVRQTAVSVSPAASPMSVTTATLPDVSVSTTKQVNQSASPLTSSALFVYPSNDVQRYVNAAAAVTTASEDMPMPTITVVRNIATDSSVFTASALFQLPSFGVTTSIDNSYSASAMTVSSEIITPTFSRTTQQNISSLTASALFASASALVVSNNSVSSSVATASALMNNSTVDFAKVVYPEAMTASALMSGGQISLATVIAAPINNTVSIDMVMPAITTELKGQIKAQPMVARNALLQTPPSYVNIFADPWYKTMYDYLIPNTTAGQGKLLKVFEDVTTNKTSGTLNNNITLTMWNNGVVNDSGNPTMAIESSYGTTDNPSLIEIGYFDNYNRKAVAIKNSSFTYYSGYGSDRNDFSMQFSIRTSKADQILASGTYSSTYSAGRFTTTYNLVDGKLNALNYAAYDAYHPKNLPASQSNYLEGAFTGNKRIDDGEWHYVTIQYAQGRLQFWIDGELDAQRFDLYLQHPRKIGANTPDLRYAPDFQTSAVFVNCHVIYSQRDLLLQHFDYQRYKPVKPEPALATATMGQGTTGKGNRKRALMLYFWTNGPGTLAQSNANRGFDSGVAGEFDGITFDPILSTMDFINNPPQQYYGWDVFPVDINGYYVSDLVKESAYGGAKNIIEQDMGGTVYQTQQYSFPKFKANRRGYFRDQKTDIRRYIDLVNDIDLSQFDSIFFANYPDQSREIDAFAKNEIVDDYFAIRETVIFNDFIKSLREAVDTGISLYVTNHQLAIDLGIVDRVEVVPDLQDTGYYYQDPYSPTIAPLEAVSLPKGAPGNAAGWQDYVKNNRTRVMNIVPGLTDIPGIIKKDELLWRNDDVLDFGGPSHPFTAYENKPNGLSVGDEFMMSAWSTSPRNYLAAPFSAVKSGTIVTAFATHQRRALERVENPYANYAQSIALSPGDVLNGKQLGGKIFVNFTEELVKSGDWGQVELIQDKWINLAYANNAITLEGRNTYLNASYNLDRQLERGAITQSQYDRDSYWSFNGMHILAQVAKFESTFAVDQQGAAQSGALQKTQGGTEASTAGTQVYQKQLWFTFKYSNQYPTVQIEVPSILTRGFRWLSNRIEPVGEIQRPLAIEATASMVMPVLTGDKSVSSSAVAMVASARITEGEGYSPKDGGFNPLPMTASAEITNKVTKVEATAMTARALFREDTAVLVSSIDEIILYVMHEDPILYLREDIIK